MGAPYVAGAWGFLQGLQYVSGTYDWPRQIQQLTTLALIVGLPIVLVLAWYHGDRGEQRVSRTELAIITLLFLLGGGICWQYERSSEKSTAAATTADVGKAHALPTDSRPSIAVLPFENRSDEKKDAFFVDGIHDDILTQLSKVSALRVISRTSVERFRKTDLSVQQIAQQLGVKSILEGGVQRTGDRVRINVQLIDADTDAHHWAESYDRELTATNIFSIQSEVATAIASALQASLTVGEHTRVNRIPTRDLAAWQAYQLGKQRMTKRTSGALIEAEEHFRKAIALDGSFALAWVGLADSLALQTSYAGRLQNAGLTDAEQATARALQLDTDLAEAWASAGNIAYQRLQFARSEQALRRAITLNANNVTAYHRLCVDLLELGRRDEALLAAEQALVLDPLSAVINAQTGVARAAVGRFDDALVAYKQAIVLDPEMPYPYRNIGAVHAWGFGRLDKAMPWYQKAAILDPGNPDLSADVAYMQWGLQDDSAAARWLAGVSPTDEGTTGTNVVAALLYLSRGDEASSRKYAQKAAELDPWNMFLIRDADIRSRDYATARARYAKAFPELFDDKLSKLTNSAAFAAIELALVLQHTGEEARADALLSYSEVYIRNIPRMGSVGYRLADVAIHALRGETTMALASLREAARAGYRMDWRYHRDYDPHLASIRNEPEFKAVFADIERDMARQRAALAARPKDAPLDLPATGT